MLELDIGYRLTHHDDLQWRPSAEVVECERGTVLEDGPVRITAAPTDHAPVRPTVGFRVEEGGRPSSSRVTRSRAPGWTSCVRGQTCSCTRWCDPI